VRQTGVHIDKLPNDRHTVDANQQDGVLLTSAADLALLSATRATSRPALRSRRDGGDTGSRRGDTGSRRGDSNRATYRGLHGVTSPYPTDVIVVAPHQSAAPIKCRFLPLRVVLLGVDNCERPRKPSKDDTADDHAQRIVQGSDRCDRVIVLAEPLVSPSESGARALLATLRMPDVHAVFEQLLDPAALSFSPSGGSTGER
jgi:hypothetical protein